MSLNEIKKLSCETYVFTRTVTIGNTFQIRMDIKPYAGSRNVRLGAKLITCCVVQILRAIATAVSLVVPDTVCIIYISVIACYICSAELNDSAYAIGSRRYADTFPVDSGVNLYVNTLTLGTYSCISS